MQERYCPYIEEEKQVYYTTDKELIKQIKEVERGRIKEYLKVHPEAEYMERINEDSPIWTIKTDIALPCATQNEVTLNSAKKLV